MFDEAKKATFALPLILYRFGAKDSNGEFKSNEYRKLWKFPKLKKDIITPHIWIRFGQVPTELSMQHNLLHLIFSPNYYESDATRTIKCGWRAIHKEELEKWGRTMNGSHLTLEEDNDGVSTFSHYIIFTF